MTTDAVTVHDYDQVVEALKTFQNQVTRLPVLMPVTI